MKEQVPVRIFADACKKARSGAKRGRCPLDDASMCYSEECNIPKFLAWLLGKETNPADADQSSEDI